MRKKQLVVTPQIAVSNGYNRSVIIDFVRKKHWFISTDWGQILEKNRILDVVQLPQMLPSYSIDSIESFTRFLMDENILSAGLVPLNHSSKKSTKTPHLQSVSIDLKQKAPIDLVTLENMSVTAVQFNFTHLKAFGIYQKYYRHLQVKNTEIIFDFSFTRCIDLNAFKQSLLHPTTLQIYNAPYSTTEHENELTIHYFDHELILRKKAIHPDIIKTAEIGHYFFRHHLHISANGEVKNGDLFKSVLGNVSTESIQKIRGKKGFQALWKAKKADTDICRDCEFKIMCIDQRPLFQRGNKSWYSTIECDYNPYICLAKGEKDYRSLAECGVFSTKRTFRIEIDLFIEQIGTAPSMRTIIR